MSMEVQVVAGEARVVKMELVAQVAVAAPEVQEGVARLRVKGAMTMRLGSVSAPIFRGSNRVGIGEFP